MATLADYRTDLDNLLATAVDGATWTTALKDEALRQALAELDGHLVYETTVTIASSGYEQSLSAISDVIEVLAVAYPWTEGGSFAPDAWAAVRWRRLGPASIVFVGVQPQAGELIRVRYTKQHRIQDLDGAAATTAPDLVRRALARGAAAYACELRIRQLSENPAIPGEAPGLLRRLADGWRTEFLDGITRAQSRRAVAWPGIGL